MMGPGIMGSGGTGLIGSLLSLTGGGTWLTDLLLLIAVGLGIWILVQNNYRTLRRPGSPYPEAPVRDDPMEILRLRYARGEISQEEYRRTAEDLGR